MEICTKPLLLAKVAQRVQDAVVMKLRNLILKSTGKKGVSQGGVRFCGFPRPARSSRVALILGISLGVRPRIAF